jgi:gliding motility-associated-like protein
LQECNEGGNQATFNLSANNNIVNGGTGAAVSWFSDPGVTVPIPNPGGYLTGSTTVYATVFDGACVSTPASIVLEVLPGPVANAPNQSLQICYTLFPPSVTENISQVESEINGGTGQTVNWYVDAAATNPIDPSDWQDLLANGWDPIYATVTDGNCESATVPVNVALSPVPTANPASSSLCSSSGGNATFDLLQLTGTITGGAPNTVEFFTDAAATMPINNPGAFSSGSATVYAVVSTPEGCTSNPAPVTLTVTPSPTANPATLEECSAGGGQAVFNLTNANSVVTGGGGGVVNWYSDPGATSLISNPANFLSGAATVYAVVNANGCNSSPAPVSLVISAGPPAFSASMSECESANNQATFDLTGLNQTVNGNSGSTVSWYLDPAGNTPILNPATFQSPSGIVYATVTSGGCESDPVPVALDVIPTPAANSTSLSKCDEGGGQVTFDLTTADQIVNGGNANAVSWFLNSNQTGQIANPGAFSSGPATVYAVVSSGGCNSAPVPVLLEILPTPQANPASLNACNNGSGQAEFNLTSLESAINGNSGNQVNWYANFNGTISISNPDNYTAPTGTVFASVTDGVCESPIVSVGLLVADNPSVTPSQSQTILCNGATTGGIGLAVSGGAFPYSFDWNNDALDGVQNPTGIGAGLYEVIVTDNNDCETTVSIELNEPDALILNCVQLNPVSADGASDGAATITFGGGTAGYELDWTGPVSGNQTESDAGAFDITDLPEGVYNIVFTDANNCETTCSFAVNGPNCIMSLDFAVSDPSCPGATDGAISLTINDGAAPFDIDWSEDAFDGEENLSGLAAGAFSVTVTDSEDCQAVASVTLADPAELVLNCSENAPVSVVGGDDGSAAIVFSGGTAPYSFTWAGPVSGSTTADDPGSLIIPDLQAGNYGLTLTDDNGCETICVFTITDPNCMMTLAISGQDAVCSGSETGSILLLINNGASPFAIDWNDDDLDGLTNPMDVPAGNYVVLVTDADGCEATASITIGQPPAIQLVCSQLTPVTVTGGSDGKAQLEIFGGIEPYTINWTGPVSGAQTMPTHGIATISDLSAGVYNITVLDSIGCSTTCTVTINSLGCNLLMDIAVENVSCPGADDGAIHIDVFNATEPITYDWTDNSLDGMSDPTGLEPGTYIVLIIDEPGCMLGALIMVNEPDTLKITCSEISPTQTVGGNDGKGGVTITGGTKPFTISWTGAADGSLTTNNSGTITIPDLVEGDYDIIVTDANGCEASCSFSIAGPLCDWVVAASVQDASCAGESDGGISLTIDGALAPLAIDWNDPGFNGQEILLNLAAGTYSVTVTDAALCMDSLTVAVGEPAAVDLACVVIADASAPGVDDGQAEITFGGGDSPYLLEWSGPSGGAQNEPLPGAVILDNLAAGNYEVIVTDGNNCKVTCTFTISDGQCNLTLELTALDATCPGDSNGAIDLTVTGGAAPLQFDWSDDNFDGIEDPSGLPAGDYTVKVTDSNGCVETASVTVGTANAEPDALLVTPAFLCTDDCINFDINLTGNAPFAVEYSITTFSGDSSQGLNTNNADNNIAICLSDIGLTGDTVVITLISVQDAACSANLGQTEVTFIESVQVLIGQTLCSGESIIVNGTVYDENNPTGTEIIPASGPNACDSIVMVELRFFDPATSSINTQLCQGQSIVVNGNTYDESNPSGTEILLGQGQNGCDSTVVISLSFSDVIETTLNPVLCPGENVTVNGNVYDENNPAGQEILLSSGGCDSIVIIDLFFPAPAFLSIEQTLCAGESVTVNGNQYDETNPAGTEILLGASVNGCDSTVQINLSFLQPASFDLVQTLCEGESVAVNGTVYDQNNPSGMETLVGAAVNGCDSIVSIGLSFVAPVSEDIELELCSGENLTVNGTVYDESNPIGTEVIVGGSTQGCDSTINVNLSFFAPAVFDLSRTLCEGEGIIVNGTPYDESNPTGTEILAGASADGCDSTVHISLNFIPASFTLLETTLCSGESIEVNGTIYDENNPSGTEIIEGGSVAGCDSTVQVSLTFLPALTGSISGDAAICPGETATLIFNLSGAATFDVQYSDGVNPPVTLSGIADGFTVEVSPTANTTYNIVQLTTAGSACSVDIGEGATVLVSDINLTASVSSDFGGFGVSCAGSSDGSAIVVAAGGIPPYSYEWSGGGSTAEISGLSAGTYEVAVQDGAGCRAEASVTLTEPEAIAVKVSAQSPACFGDEDGLIIIDEILGGATPIEYSLDGEFFQVIPGAPFVIGNLSAGLYNLQLQDDNDCTTEISLTVPAPVELLLDLGEDRTIRLGDSLLLNPIVNFDVAQFQWSPADFLSDPGSLSGFTRPTESVLYQLTATDSSGCTISEQIRITINRERNVLVPNVFSPNDDGVNDVLTVFGGADVLEVKIFRIFDRWGNLVYEAGPFQPNDLLMGWDGKFNGQVMNPAVFVYFADVEFVDGQVIRFSGDVTLVEMIE